MNMYSDEV